MIDGHAFLGKSIYMEQSSGDLISKMDRLGLKATVVIAPPPGPFYEDANNLIRERAIEFPDRLIPIFRTNPHLDKDICTLIKSQFLEERLKKGSQIFQGLFPRRECVCYAR